MLVAYVSLLSLTLAWGFTFPLVQAALHSASPMVFIGLRFGLAAVVFPLLVWPRAFRLNHTLLWKGAVLGILLGAGYALQTFGLGLTTAARAGFLTGTLVPMTPLFAWLLFRERINRRQIIAVVLAFAGTAIMSEPSAGGLNLGDALTLLCAVSFALQVVYVGRWAKHENEIQLSWLQIAAVMLLAGLAIPLEAPRLTFSPLLLAALLITSLLATTLGVWAQMRYQPRISTTAAAIIYAMEPVFAGLASWIILGAVPGIATLTGAGFIFAGMLLSASTPSPVKPEIP
ncbi:MAG TPA: DMT family transporter [bacterium]|jgi:drug/metabolite transporter (DMT)-like permease